ncbi:MAG: PQQ-like beta-propeller repeat protein, partial [Fimbriimonas ginsengisoli]|nr:PQQ-like beta-propeller repeat protein [Fimbriimonas ginsengisoli]
VPDGDYDIYVWRAGDNAGQTFAHGERVEVHEGSTITTFDVDFSQGGGWFKIGTRKFKHSDITGDDLTVFITNYGTDAGDGTRTAYADAVWFLGTSTGNVNSTPVQATVNVKIGASVVSKACVFVCAEDGHIYCLDADGHRDSSNALTGTTDVYWVYPSVPDLSNPTWTDPNQVAGLDGPGGIAEMPRSFDLTAAVVQNIAGTDYLLVGSSNGRVYAIDVTGRGDMDLVNGKPGTTTRVWSYPDDYPSQAKTSDLGSFRGSLAFATATAGPTLFVPAAQGRMIALDAVGNSVTKTTTVRWAYPDFTQPTLGSITTTPSVDFGNVYFGTSMNQNGASPGQFVALNADSGALVWSYDGTSGPAACDNFFGGPATAPASQLGGGMGDTVFASNENRFIYAFDAAAGTLLWSTNELDSGVLGALTFSYMTVLDNTGTSNVTVPGLFVPTRDGRFVGLFARTGDLNRLGTRRAYEYNAVNELVASIAIGFQWMYGADIAGNLYAFNNGTTLINPGTNPPPGEVGVVENDLSGQIFQSAKLKFITKDAYQKLRDPVVANQLTYADIASGTYDVAVNAVEWGQTLYAILWDYPYAVGGVSGPVPPPVANFQFSVEGATLRSASEQTQLFKDRDSYDPANGHNDGNGGFSILSFSIQGSGPNALPPGHARLATSLTSAATTSDGRSVKIDLNPALAKKDFVIANPLALVMGDPLDTLRTIGYSTDPTTAQNEVNGSPNVGANEDALAATIGSVAHGQTGNVQISVVDRSLVTLLKGPGRGLEQVRVSRKDLGWRGGTPAVAKPLPGYAQAVGFEDLPASFPNSSLDYPDIRRERISVAKDPNGTSENPLNNGVALFAPTGVNELTPLTRVLTLTPFLFSVDVPKYQPANATLFTDSEGASIPGGYGGLTTLFVDSSGTGVFDITSTTRQAYRTFNLTGGVPVDEHFSVGTPVVDLGSLPVGAGFSPAPPWDTVNSLFTP